MATQKGGISFYHSAQQSVRVPVFSDLEKYLPQQQPNKESSLLPINQKYREPILGPSFHERGIPLPLDKISNLSNMSTSSAASAVRDNVVVNFTQEQRTISVSSGENIYGGNGHDPSKRPAKRRHHSDITPGFIDDTSFHTQYKRARMNYLSQGPVQRSLKFKQYEVPPPVFTLETLTSEIKQECAKSLQSTETLEKKLKLKSFLEILLSSFLPGCTLHLCGSSSSGFGNNSSDADFCLILSHITQGTNRRETILVLRHICRVLHGDRYSFIGKLQVIPATVPILKFMDTISGCECDININNIVGVKNTHLLRGYCGVDFRVQPLVLLVKKWAKKQDINDASHGTLSSYALTLMVIHYLQAVCKPAVVPILQLKYPAIFQYQEDVRNLLNEDPCSHIACNKSDNQQSLGELLLGFFKYYAEDFRWTEHYISIKMGSALPRSLKHNKRKHIIIEEPFDGNNVAKAVCKEGQLLQFGFYSQTKNDKVTVFEPFDGNNVAKAVCKEGQFNRISLKFRLAWHTLRISPSLESIKVT